MNLKRGGPVIKHTRVGDNYRADEVFRYKSPRYYKTITTPFHYISNGADLVKDLIPDAFFTHDVGCVKGTWDDGTKMCNRELSFVYFDILRSYKVPLWRCVERWFGTFLFGGGAARDNGMLWVNRGPKK